MSETSMDDFFEVVCSENFDGAPIKILVNSGTTANYKTIIEQSQEEDFRIMTERELNRRLEKGQAHYRVAELNWVFSNEKEAKQSHELIIEATVRPVGVEDL